MKSDGKSLIESLVKNAVALGEASTNTRQAQNYIKSLKIETQVYQMRLPRRIAYTARKNVHPAKRANGSGGLSSKLTLAIRGFSSFWARSHLFMKNQAEIVQVSPSKDEIVPVEG